MFRPHPEPPHGSGRDDEAFWALVASLGGHFGTSRHRIGGGCFSSSASSCFWPLVCPSPPLPWAFPEPPPCPPPPGGGWSLWFVLASFRGAVAPATRLRRSLLRSGVRRGLSRSVFEFLGMGLFGAVRLWIFTPCRPFRAFRQLGILHARPEGRGTKAMGGWVHTVKRHARRIRTGAPVDLLARGGAGALAGSGGWAGLCCAGADGDLPEAVL